jgi:hypothetical protein
MSAWRAGKIQWFSDDFEEGLIVDTEDGEFYYLNTSAAKKLKSIKNKKNLEDIKFKLTTGPRSVKATDVKIKDEVSE